MKKKPVSYRRARLLVRERIRLNAAIERALATDIKRWIARVGKVAAAHLRNGHIAASENAGRELQSRLHRILRARISDACRASARLVIRDLLKAAPFALERKGFIDDIVSASLDWVETYAARRVSQIVESTRKILNRLIYSAVDVGSGYRETAKKIVEATDGNIGTSRAVRIARTEIHGAMERGNLEAIRATGFDYDKQWVAVEDGRTRESHALADGQVVRLDEQFTVGGFKMDYPGDHDAPPSETINCRCVVLNIPGILR